MLNYSHLQVDLDSLFYNFDMTNSTEAVASDETAKAFTVTEKDDIGLQFIAQHGVEAYTPEEEKKVRWKLDLNLMPMVSGLPGFKRTRDDSND